MKRGSETSVRDELMKLANRTISKMVKEAERLLDQEGLSQKEEKYVVTCFGNDVYLNMCEFRDARFPE